VALPGVGGAVEVVVLVLVDVLELVLEESVPLSSPPHAAINGLSASAAVMPATAERRRGIEMSVIGQDSIRVSFGRDCTGPATHSNRVSSNGRQASASA
jgi:hypothetical protein